MILAGYQLVFWFCKHALVCVDSRRQCLGDDFADFDRCPNTEFTGELDVKKHKIGW